MKGELKLKLNAEEETLQENEIHFVPKSTATCERIEIFAHMPSRGRTSVPATTLLHGSAHKWRAPTGAACNGTS